MHYLTFIRHGESAGNAGRIIQGQSEYPLTTLGLIQAQEIARSWKAAGVHFDRIFCSPLERARITASTIAEALGRPFEVDPVWLERSFGQIEGMEYEEVFRQDLNLEFNDPFKPVGGSGESLTALYNRLSQGIQSLVQRPDGSYLVVSHGAALNMAMMVMLGLSPVGNSTTPRFPFGNTTYVNLDYDARKRQWRLISFVSPAPLVGYHEQNIGTVRAV